MVYAELPGGGVGPLFTATLRSGAGGITSGNDTGLHWIDGARTVTEVLREKQPIGDKVVKKFTVLKAISGSEGTTRSFNANQEIVANVTFTDDTVGIVKSQVP